MNSKDSYKLNVFVFFLFVLHISTVFLESPNFHLGSGWEDDRLAVVHDWIQEFTFFIVDLLWLAVCNIDLPDDIAF